MTDVMRVFAGEVRNVETMWLYVGDIIRLEAVEDRNECIVATVISRDKARVEYDSTGNIPIGTERLLRDLTKGMWTDIADREIYKVGTKEETR